MKFYVEMEYLDAKGRLILHRDRVSSLTEARSVCQGIYEIVATVKATLSNDGTAPRSWAFFNDYTNHVVILKAKEYGDGCQIQEGVFVL